MKRVIISVLIVLSLSVCAGSAGQEKRYDSVSVAVNTDGQGIAGQYGQLKVIGAKLTDSNGNPAQLRGVSSHGLQWFPQYANKNVIKWLRDDWKATLWRAAMYTEPGDTNGYISNPAVKKRVTDSVEAAIELGIYVIIDWHILHDKDPRKYQKQAIAFFSEMARKYGGYPNVMYEICNEPNGDAVTWDGSIKPYAEAVIPAIRKYDPDNIIIVGTPRWSQLINEAADNPITGYDNIMYALHFYSGTHRGWLRDAAKDVIEQGLPVFVTEFGTPDSSGDGAVEKEETLLWFSFMEKYNISWANWSLANKAESSAILRPGADSNGKGNWKDSDLSESGAFIRGVMRGEITIPPYEE
jgi:endoglucanase